MSTAAIQGELWGLAARDWASLQEPQHSPLFEAMLDAANVSAGVSILDAGCGGGTASWLAAQRGAEIAGLDAAEALINVARERVPAGDFRVGDILALPFADQRFDAVLAANSIQYSDEPAETFRELRRVCKTGGRIVVALFAEEERVEWGRVLRAINAALGDPPRSGGPFALSKPGILEGLAESAGLTVLDAGEVNCPFVYPDFETYWRGLSASGQHQGVIRRFGADTLKSAMQQATAPYITADGGVGIGPNHFRYILAQA